MRNWPEKTTAWRTLQVLSGPAVFLSKGIQEFVELLAGKWGIKALYLYIAFAVTSSLLFELLAFFYAVYFRWKTVFSPTERNSPQYKERLKSIIKNSTRIRFLVLSAHTMFHDNSESFIWETIRDLSATERRSKDIQFLLLHPDSKNFSERADDFLEESKGITGDHRLNSAEEYRLRYKQIIAELRAKEIPIRFYSFIPIWRLQIFDSEVLCSFYSDDASGHKTSCYSFKKKDQYSIYFAFDKYFDWMWKGSAKQLGDWPRQVVCPNCEHKFPYSGALSSEMAKDPPSLSN